MKVSAAAAFLAVMAVCASSASGADCSAAQLASLRVDDDNKAFETACPALFQDGSEVLNPTDAKTFSKDVLEAIAPCKSTSCTNYLTQLTASTPDCDVIGINVKGLYNAVLTVCKKFAAGTVSEEELEQIFEDVISTSPLLEIGSVDNSTSTGTGNSTSTTNATAPVATTTTPAQPDKDSVPASSSTMPSPAPTPTKSAASVLTGVTAVATASILSAFLL